jgi:hypothetical protein
MLIRSLAILLLLMTCLGAGEAKPKANALAGKADARREFSRQAATAPTPNGPIPAIVGCFLWNSRADENYKPFFQWEIRLKSGSASLSGLKIRVATLGPQQQVIMLGPWKNLGDLPANTAIEFDYRLNCTNTPAYRVEVAWQGGEEKFLAWDRVMVPIALSSLKERPMLACVEGNAESDKKQNATLATWWLWNVGGQAVKEGVSVTVTFLNDKGKSEYSAVWKQPNNSPIPPYSAKEWRLPIRQAINFAGLSFQVTQPSGIEAGSVNAGGVVVSAVAHDGPDGLKARVKNASTGDLTGLVVTIALLDQKDKRIASAILPAIDLRVGDEKEVKTKLNKTVDWANFEISWDLASGGGAEGPVPTTTKTGGEDAAGSGRDSRNAQSLCLSVKGLDFTEITTKPAKKGMTVSGSLKNTTGKKIENLTITFSVQGAAGAAPVTVDVGDLEKDQALRLEFVAKGIEEVQGLEMSWASMSKAH